MTYHPPEKALKIVRLPEMEIIYQFHQGKWDLVYIIGKVPADVIKESESSKWRSQYEGSWNISSEETL